MRSLIAISCVAFACLLSQMAIAQNEGPAVPIEKAPYHLPVFKNEYVTVLKIDVPPHRNTGFHIHTTDSVSMNIEDADMANQLPAEKQTPPQHSKRGQANFTAYSKQTPRIHKASNMGETPFHNVSFILNYPQPGRFSPSSRAGVSGYTETMDNERVRGWRLVLEPGQTAGVFTQTAPGLRIVMGARAVVELTTAELQRFLNQYVEKGSSSSLLSKILRYIQVVLNIAVDRSLIEQSPARNLKARSRKRVCEQNHTLEECEALLGQLSGRDRLILRLLIQLGLRSEELFVLRRDDVLGSALVIDEAIVRGRLKCTKTEESAAVMYVPPDLEIELQHYLETLSDDNPRAWLFPASRKAVALRPENFLKRVLKPAAIRAKIGLNKNRQGKDVTGCNFQSMRRTSATLFGARAKDPRLTQAHLRHTDPRVTLKHYQKEIPAEVRAAARALETDFLAARQRREAEQATVAQIN